MSSPKQELGLIREFKELHSYVSRLGQQFNLIYKRLEGLEMQLTQMSQKFGESTAANRNEISVIHQKMFTKSEFEDFIKELQITVEEQLPPLLSLISKSSEAEELTSQQTVEAPQQSEPSEKQKGRLFNWGRRDSAKKQY